MPVAAAYPVRLDAKHHAVPQERRGGNVANDERSLCGLEDGSAHRFDTVYPVLGGKAQSELAMALGGAVDDSIFPVRYEIEHVRVYQAT